MMLLLGIIPVAVLLLYAVWINLRFPHVRGIAAREIALNKPAAILTIVGLSISTALITPLLAMLLTYSEGTDRYARQHLDHIEYEIPAIEQSVLPKHYYEPEEMRTMLRSTGGNESALLPIISYKITLSRGTGDSPEAFLPNVLVVGVDMAQALEWDPGLRELNWPETLQGDRIVLSETAANKLKARAGDVVHVLDLDNRKIDFVVDRIVPERGLTGYLGVQRADATAIVDAEAARKLFRLPEGAYTSAVGSSFPAPPWHTAYVRQESVRTASDANPTYYAIYFFGVPVLNAFLMSILLTINLFRMIAEERKPGMRTMRTLGFSRLDLKRMLRLEALYYAGIACTIGGLTGVALTIGLVKGYKRYSGLIPESSLLLGADLLFRSVLLSLSIGIGVVFACMWFVSQRALSYGEMGMVYAKERRGSPSAETSRHAWISALLLMLLVFLTALTALPNIRESWLAGRDFAAFSAFVFLLIIPVFGYAGGRWLEWACRLVLAAFRKSSGAYGMLNLGLAQLKANRVRTGLLLVMFCSVSCLASFSTVLADYNGRVIDQTDSRTATGGYDYYAEDIRIVPTEQLRGYLTDVRYPQDNAPIATSVVILPWKEADWRNYTINGIDADYAKTNELLVVADNTRTGNVQNPWKTLLADPDSIIVSSGALSFLGGLSLLGDNEETIVTFDANGRRVSKRIVGVVEEQQTSYPAKSGIWMNAQEALRLGEGVKSMHSAIFLRFADEEQARSWQAKTAEALARFNVSHLQSAEENEVGYFLNIGLLLNLFESFNLLALAIGITGLAVVMLRAAKLRRRELGVLRSIGIPPRLLRMYMWTEGFLTGAFGALSGFVAGGYFAYVLCEPQTGDVIYGVAFVFVPQWTRLLAMLAAILLMVALTTYWSARSVYRVSPIESTKSIPS